MSDSYSQAELGYPGDRLYSGGEIRTRKKYRYGRCEVRMKAPHELSGFVQSVFTFHYPKLPVWDEIDWELQGRHPDRAASNMIVGKYAKEWADTRDFGSYEHEVSLPHGSLISDWHVYAFEWTPDFIKWYIDGHLMRTLTRGALHPRGWIPGDDSPFGGQSSEIMMNFWLPNPEIMADFGGCWNEAAFDHGRSVDATYDWFRYYSLDAYQPKS
ncbi:Glycosyl hydrolases family 16 [Pseudobacteriovorax antillogorgiicola]|uniref:Glycosyl hydrolases family 16 n=2 Tax=Pseudobacteriovorax antillogorgiicola TaxID=1513793 RepID=A0A1Y6CTR1_9BACT|nr:glycosyl hydrolase family 16 [Pseudobacteriovorax antillogorgiicola]SMF77379.1 Glycosyl hydrolases family 16 [Pseudobacteriovorax antillogorgiicola]